MFNTLCFAQIKTFTKQGESVVQKDQSVNQVISYLKQKLTREAQEEAGTFITTNLKIENYQITKDKFTSFAGSISKTTVLEEMPFMKDKEQYVKVKIKVDIDTDNVKAYLEKIMQDNEYKEQAQKAIKEAEELKKKNLELENKLKTATKQEYEQNLSLQAEQQIQEQKQREIELNKMALQAKEEYTKIKEEQLQLQQKREQKILKLKEKIAQEKDNVKKAELENQAKIKELELKAKENQQDWNTNTNKISIQQAIQEATKVKQETAEITNKFEILIKENKEKITKSYDEQIQLSCNTNPKDQWETEEEYNTRLEKNKKIKEKLEKEKENSIFSDEINSLLSMINTLEPFVKKLQYFQTIGFYDNDSDKAKLIGIEEINADKQYFMLNVQYGKETYLLKYDFSKIGKEQAKLMCQTQNQFVIEPLFSVDSGKEIIYKYSKLKVLEAFEINGDRYVVTKIDITNNTDDSIKNICCSDFNKKAKNFYINFEYANEQYSILFDFSNIKEKEAKKMYEKAKFEIKPIFDYEEYKETVENKKEKILSAFKVKHLGTKQEKILTLPITISYFDEINIFLYKKRLYNFKTDKNLKKYTGLINNLEKIKSKDTINRIINNLDNLIIAISAGKGHTEFEGKGHTVGLKRDGTVVAVGNNEYGKCNVSSWKDIVAISAGYNNTVGLKKDGTVVAVGNNEYGKCNKVSSWKDIVAISAGYYHTVGLKKNGTVVAVGANGYRECNVENWKGIVAISAGYYHTVGLKKDGTVVATGYNNYYGQCDVGNWKGIVAISAGDDHTVGLKRDGTVVAIGYNTEGRCDVGNWKDIVAISAGYNHTVGLKADGTVVAVGNNGWGECDGENFGDDLIAISAGYYHTIGLKADGTVIAVGLNKDGECDVQNWNLKLSEFELEQ